MAFRDRRTGTPFAALRWPHRAGPFRETQCRDCNASRDPPRQKRRRIQGPVSVHRTSPRDQLRRRRQMEKLWQRHSGEYELRARGKSGAAASERWPLEPARLRTRSLPLLTPTSWAHSAAQQACPDSQRKRRRELSQPSAARPAGTCLAEPSPARALAVRAWGRPSLPEREALAGLRARLSGNLPRGTLRYRRQTLPEPEQLRLPVLRVRLERA